MCTRRQIKFLLFISLLLASSLAFETTLRPTTVRAVRTALPNSSQDVGIPGMSRRSAIGSLTTTTLISTLDSFRFNANAEMIQLPAESAELPVGLLASRVLSNVLSPPPYGMEGPDIFYPSWFAGTWSVVSECTDVLAPCGIELFGGNRTYEAALAERGRSKALIYQSRFIPLGDCIIADREFNVKSIAKVALGENSLVDISLSTPNKFSCLLSLENAPSLVTVDLLVLNRRQEQESAIRFDCAEVVREIVSGVQRASSIILKEVETTSLYTLDESNGNIQCRQRSATFLLPSQQDPIAFQMWQATRGRPIEVRYFDVQYSKKTV